MIKVDRREMDFNKEKEYESLRRLDDNVDIILRKVLDDYPRNLFGLRAVEIETINRCNNDCSFCPVNRNADKREYKKMSETLFRSIIDQLEDISFGGRIALFSNNEPLLDKRIFGFIEYAKQHLPHAHHYLYTNGKLLDDIKFERLTKYLDELVIDDYDDSFQMSSNIKELYNKYKDEEVNCDVTIALRKKNQILDTRGGVSPNRGVLNKFNSTCQFPFGQLIIRPDGKVSKCCQDALGLTTLGDFTNQTLKEIWEGQEFNILRNDLQNGKRKFLPQCQYCDFSLSGDYFGLDWNTRVMNALGNILWDKIVMQNKKIYLYDDDRRWTMVLGILSALQIPISGVLTTEHELETTDNETFVLFPEPKWSLYMVMDKMKKRVGCDYLFCDIVTGSYKSNINKQWNLEKKMWVSSLKTALTRNKIYIFGTGAVLLRVFKLFDFVKDDIDGFLDNDVNKQGTKLLGCMIYDPNILKGEKDEFTVVIASKHGREMTRQLLQEKLCNKGQIINGYDLL